MGTSELARRRRRLMEVSPYCDECGTEVFEYTLHPGQITPPNQATIQHVNSRIKYPDGRPWKGQRILMCYQCNQEDAVREKEETRAEKERQALLDSMFGELPPVRPRGRKGPL